MEAEESPDSLGWAPIPLKAETRSERMARLESQWVYHSFHNQDPPLEPPRVEYREWGESEMTFKGWEETAAPDEHFSEEALPQQASDEKHFAFDPSKAYERWYLDEIMNEIRNASHDYIVEQEEKIIAGSKLAHKIERFGRNRLEPRKERIPPPAKPFRLKKLWQIEHGDGVAVRDALRPMKEVAWWDEASANTSVRGEGADEPADHPSRLKYKEYLSALDDRHEEILAQRRRMCQEGWKGARPFKNYSLPPDDRRGLEEEIGQERDFLDTFTNVYGKSWAVKNLKE
jgi:hypothetical protein